MRKSRFAWSVQRRLIEQFASGSTARMAAALVGVNKSTAALYFLRLREIIVQESEDMSPLFGEIEVDESYFGGHRKGKRGRGAAGKVPMFGLLKTRWQGLCQGHPQRKRADAEGHHRHQGGARLDRLLGHAQLVQRARRVQLQALPYQPLQAVLRSEKTHQRHRERLEPGPASHASLQRCTDSPLPPLFERVRMAFQYTAT